MDLLEGDGSRGNLWPNSIQAVGWKGVPGGLVFCRLGQPCVSGHTQKEEGKAEKKRKRGRKRKGERKEATLTNVKLLREMIGEWKKTFITIIIL